MAADEIEQHIADLVQLGVKASEAVDVFARSPIVETPREAAVRILQKHGLALKSGRGAVPASVYHDLDADL